MYDPADKQAPAERLPVQVGRRRPSVADPRGRTVDLKRIVGSPHPRAIVPLDWVRDEGPPGAPCSSSASGSPSTASTPTGRTGPRATCCCGRPPRVGQAAGEPLRRDGETDLEAARRLAARARPRRRSPIQGPPGSGKTYTGARMILDAARAPASGSGITGDQPQGHRQPPRELSLEAADDATASTVRAGPAAARGQVLVDDRVDAPRRTRRTSGRARRTARANLAAGTSWLWASAKMVGRGRRALRRRGRPDLAGQRRRDRTRDGQPRPARRPAAARPAARRARIRRAPIGRRWRTSSATHATMPADRGLFLETDLAAPSGPVRVHVRGVLRRPAGAGAAPRRPARSRRPATSRRRRASRLVDVATAGADNESPEEAEAVAALARAIVEGGATWIDRARARADRSTWDDILIVAPYNAQVGAIERRLPPAARVGTVDKFQGQEAPISIYSMTTSSPGARATRDGLPVQPPPAQRRDLASALRQRRGRVTGSVPGARADAGADAAGECVLPVRGAGLSRAGSVASGRSARLSR